MKNEKKIIIAVIFISGCQRDGRLLGLESMSLTKKGIKFDFTFSWKKVVKSYNEPIPITQAL